MDSIIQDLREKAVKSLSDLDIKIGTGKKLNNLDFSKSVIDKSPRLEKAFNTIQSWTDTTAAGLDKLKKKLDLFAREVPTIEKSGGVYNTINSWRNLLNDSLKKSISGYEQMTNKYRLASEMIDEIEKTLSLKDTASRDTTLRKLISIFRNNNDLRREFVEQLSDKTGKDIIGKLAGLQLSKVMPEGLAGRLIGGTISLGIISPQALPSLLLYFAASSPRLLAEFANLLGKLDKKALSGKILPPFAQRELRLLLIKSMQENND